MKILKDLREGAGLTLRQVEESTGISNAYLSQLENGKIKKPSANALYKLAKLYGTEVEKLLIEAGYIKEINLEAVPVRPTVQAQIDALEKRVKTLENKSFMYDPLNSFE